MKKSTLTLTLFLLMLLLSGCSTLVETFGKEYRLVDDFFEQLDADIKLSFEDYLAEHDVSPEQKTLINKSLNEASLRIEIQKSQMKSRVSGLKDSLVSLGYNGSVEDYIESALAEIREGVKQEMESATNGQVALKSADVSRGFFGSIWHFIRNHWLISLIILFVLIACLGRAQG